MEVSLPLSGEVKSGNRGSRRELAPTLPLGKAGGFASAATASIALPLSFMVAGLLALFGGAIWLVAEPGLLVKYNYNPATIALTHLFVLGWLGSIVMGAMYQLVPVALETKLYSERLAKIQFAFHAVGFVGMVLAFRVWNMKWVGGFGSVLAIGICLFVYNIARTLLRVPKWNVVAAAVASALAWISLAITAGLLIAAAKQGHANFVFRFNPLGAMHAHAHLGVVGFFTLLIVGVSYKLIPMFTLSEVQNRARAAVSVVLLNLGLAGSFAAILVQNALKPVFAAVVVAALALYGWELTAVLRARKRRALDWGVRYFLTALALLAPLSILAVILSWPRLPLNTFTGQLENLYGFLGLIGFVSFAVIGMLYKIIPFLIWFGTYSRHIGRAQVPALAQMYSARLQMAGYWVFLAALFATSAGIVVSNAVVARIGCALFAASLATLAINVGTILSHYFHPQLKPMEFARHHQSSIVNHKS